MNKSENEYYVITTKYGFVYNVFEDYSDVNENHPEYCLYNVEFSDDIRHVNRFRSKNDDAPKYAVSKIHNWRDLTVDKWCEEIGGELILVKEINSHETHPSPQQLLLHKTTEYYVSYSKFFEGNFPQVYFDNDKIFETEE